MAALPIFVTNVTNITLLLNGLQVQRFLQEILAVLQSGKIRTKRKLIYVTEIWKGISRQTGIMQQNYSK